MTSLAFSSTSVRGAMLPAAVLVLATAWIYTPVYHGDFLWDDGVLITKNWMVKSGSLGGLAAIWIEPDGPDYFPLTYTALWFQWQAFGDDPTGYHLTNICLHALSGLLLWGLLNQLKLPGAWLASLIFTVHPVCVESVAWISEIKNTLSLSLFLLACWCWVRQDECQQPATRTWWYAGSLLAFLLALLAKPTMVGLPLLTLLYAWWQRYMVNRQDLLRMLPMLLLAVVIGLVTVWFQHERAIGGEVLPIGGPLSRLAVAGLAIVFYLATIVWPVGLVPVYPRWSVQPVEAWQLLPWLGLAVVGWISWQHRRSWGRQLIMAGGFFLLMVAPVLGFVDMAFMRISWVSDHFLYLPMIGPLVGLVTGGARLLVGCTDQLRLLTRILVILLAGLLALVSHREARHWQNSDILWTYTTAMNKEAWPAIVGLGDIRFASGDFEGAALHYRRAAELHPALISTWHYRDAMMEILVRQRKYAEAFETLEAAFAGNEDQIGRQPVHDVFAKKTKAVQKAQCLIEQLQRVGPDDSERNTFSRELSEWLDQQIAQPTSDDL